MMTPPSDTRPRVSVIIPVFDGERTLRRAIESVLAQSIPTELIVVDDGSTDGSATIAESLGARVIRQPNSGPAAARNRGIAEARGELLAFNDADDAWTPGRLARQLEALDASPELDFVICDFENVVDDGFPMARWAFRDDPRAASAASPSGGMTGFIFQALLARRRAFDAIGVLDESMRWAEDSDWFLRAHDAGLAAQRLEFIGVTRYVHDRNLTGNVAQSHKGLVRAIHASVVRRRNRAQSPR